MLLIVSKYSFLESEQVILFQSSKFFFLIFKYNIWQIFMRLYIQMEYGILMSWLDSQKN